MLKNKRIVMIVLAAALVFAGIAGAVYAQDATPEADTAAQTAYLGVTIAPDDAGARVDRVLAGSPAEAAGLEAGDVIVSIDGEPVTADSLVTAIAGRAVGDVVALEVLRGEETLTVEATLGARPDDGRAGRRNDGRFGQGFGFDFGRGFNSGELEFLPEEGVLVVGELAEDSPLADAGLQAGDRITAINGEALDGGQLRLIVPNLNDADAGLTLTVERGSESLELEISAEVALGLFLGGMHQGMPDMPGMPFGEGRQNGRDFGQRFNGPDGQGFGFGLRGPRSYLGVAFATLDEQVAADNNVTVTDGALVTEVAEDSPAAAAGLMVNDIITAVNGEPVNAEWTLVDRIAAYEPGDVLTLEVLRGEESLQIEVTLAEREGRVELPLPGMGGQRGRPFGFGQGMPADPTAPQPPTVPGGVSL